MEPEVEVKCVLAEYVYSFNAYGTLETGTEALACARIHSTTSTAYVYFSNNQVHGHVLKLVTYVNFDSHYVTCWPISG